MVSRTSIIAGDRKKAEARISNSSNKFLDVHNVEVFIEGSGASAENVRFDRTIADNSSGTIKFDVVASPDAETGTRKATTRVSATFRDGTYCATSELQSGFTVFVSAKGGSASPVQAPSNIYGGGTAYNVIGSAEYRKAKEQNGWKEIEFAGSGSNYAQNYADYGTSYGQGAKNENSGSAGYGPALPYYGTEPLPAMNCEGLSVSKENFSVKAGSEKTRHFLLRNYAPQDFTIDYIEAVEHSPEFYVEASRDSPRVFAGQSGAIKVKVVAYESGEDATGSAYIKVKGHYDSGLECAIDSENFLVGVNASENDLLEMVSLSVSDAQLEGKSGFIEFSLDNPSNQTIEVDIYAKGAMVSPQKILFGPETSGSRRIAVNGVNGKATVYFKAGTGSRQLIEKFSEVKAGKTARAAEVIEVPVKKMNAGAIGGIGGFVNAGLSTLSKNALGLGIAALIIIVLIIITAPKKINGKEKEQVQD